MKSTHIEGKVDRIKKLDNAYIAFTLEGLYSGYMFVGKLDSENISVEEELKMSLTNSGDLVSFTYRLKSDDLEEFEIVNFENLMLKHYEFAETSIDKLMSESLNPN